MDGTNRQIGISRGPASPGYLLLMGIAATVAWPDVANAEDFSCDARTEAPLSCRVTPTNAVVCEATSVSGAVGLDELTTCVDRRFSTGANPIVTIAAFGGGSEPTDRYDDWNGGTALTTHKLATLRNELGGGALYYDVAYPLLESTGKAPYPGQATLVTTRRVESKKDARSLDAGYTLLVAAGGGAHGKVISGEAVEDAQRGGFGGYADGWAGVPCPYNEGVCAGGTAGGSAQGAPGGDGGSERRSVAFVSAEANGVEDSFADRFAWGGHGGAGHPHGGGGQALEKLTRMSAGGGGGGGSFARRSTRPTPKDLEALMPRAPAFQIIFQRDGHYSQIEWQRAQFSGERVDAYQVKALAGRTTLSITVEDPGAPTTDLELGGLVLVEGCGRDSRRMEPYRLTGLMNLGKGFTTTDDSKLHYRVYDVDGALVGTAESQAAAALVLDKSLDLVFYHTDRVGNRGRMSLFADSGASGVAPSSRLCGR